MLFNKIEVAFILLLLKNTKDKITDNKKKHTELNVLTPIQIYNQVKQLDL